MACTSLVALPRTCGFDGTIGGMDKLYMIAYKDLDSSVNGDPTTVALGVISSIALVDQDVKFVEVGLLRNSAEVTEKFANDFSKGTAFLTQTLKIVLSGLTQANLAYVQSVQSQPVALIFKNRSGHYYFMGGNGRFQLKDYEGGSGTAEADMQGYTLNFEGTGIDPIREVDPTLISTVVAL